MYASVESLADEIFPLCSPGPQRWEKNAASILSSRQKMGQHNVEMLLSKSLPR